MYPILNDRFFKEAFSIDDHTAVEIKAKENVSAGDLRGLKALAQKQRLKRYLCVSLEPRARKIEGVSVLPYQEFLEALWQGQYS